jgi:hypothetical protein
MGSPNATVNPLRSVGLILDDVARAGCCGGADNVNTIRAGDRPAGTDAGGGGEGAGRPATNTDTGRERDVPAPAGEAVPQLLVVGGDRDGESTPWPTTEGGINSDSRWRSSL